MYLHCHSGSILLYYYYCVFTYTTRGFCKHAIAHGYLAVLLRRMEAMHHFHGGHKIKGKMVSLKTVTDSRPPQHPSTSLTSESTLEGRRAVSMFRAQQARVEVKISLFCDL